MSQTLYAMPSEFAAGTTVSYRRLLVDYPASAGWVLTTYLAGAKLIETEGVADGDAHVVTFSAAATAALVKGVYRWCERVALSGAVYEIASGHVDVSADIAQATEGSEQDWLERAIAALRAHIENRLPAALQTYQIAGRAVSKMTIPEALEVLASFESRLAAIAEPSTVLRPILVSFSQPGFGDAE